METKSNPDTLQQFDTIHELCKDIFIKKMKDYGSSWRILRLSSITDQIFIKAQRIRSIEDKGMQKIQDDIKSEYIGILNYCIIALIQMELINDDNKDLSLDIADKLYDKYFFGAKSLMENKNHDYDEAWRVMRLSSLTDIILMKLLRIKQIEDNNGKTHISEGIDANYFDIINYACFALIRLTFL
ncbi:MAG: DUF1599 domain-containing protein [Bacteroidota bacterium]|nr:DUF1599 domain-containing protein [Bacteroidota bacterium]